MDIQSHCGELPTPDRFRPVKNDIRVKPKGGLWTSTWDWENTTSDWLEWCRGAMPEWADAPIHLLYPQDNLRVYTIDAWADLSQLLERFPLRDVPGVPKYIIESLKTFALLNWEKISEEYDAVHLTVEGQQATRWSRPSLYGWDCESTLHFRWNFK